MSEYLCDGPLPIDWVYDDLNDAHEHDLMHIMYSSIDYINDGDFE
mgnify:FL=1